IRTSNPVPIVASKNTVTGAIHATLSNPPRMGDASTVAPYFAANQFKIEVFDPPPSISVCNSLIMTGETGHPTWLHSSKTCPHPHVQIISCPTLLNRDEGSAPSITTASTQTRQASTHRCSERPLPLLFLASRWAKASALAFSEPSTNGGFSPWGMPSSALPTKNRLSMMNLSH